MVHAYLLPFDFWQVVLKTKPSHFTSQVAPLEPFGLKVAPWNKALLFIRVIYSFTWTVTPLTVFELELKLLSTPPPAQDTSQFATLHSFISGLLQISDPPRKIIFKRKLNQTVLGCFLSQPFWVQVEVEIEVEVEVEAQVEIEVWLSRDWYWVEV